MADKVTDVEPYSISELIHSRGYSSSAMAATLTNLSLKEDARLWYYWGKEWIEVSCEDGKKAMILRNPSKAFELYGREWNAKLAGVADILKQINVAIDIEVSKKIEQLFKNLDYVNAALREMYYNHYLTFMGSPCTEKSQDEKRRMDRLVGAATMNLVTFRMILESNGSKDVDKLNEQIIRLAEKIADMMLTRS